MGNVDKLRVRGSRGDLERNRVFRQKPTSVLSVIDRRLSTQSSVSSDAEHLKNFWADGRSFLT